MPHAPLASGIAARGLWPPRAGLCAVCRQGCRGGLCADCRQGFAPPRPRCLRCARTLAQPAVCGECARVPPAFDRCVAWADYASPWRELIAGFKYRQRVELAGAFAAGLAEAIRSVDGAAGIERVLPVPLASQRLRERGYNQAWEIARRVARALRLPASVDVLQRLRDTAHQIGMTREQRERNLRDAFYVDTSRRRGVAGQRVALVDDVLTTGATAQAAALALRRAGAAGVELWVLARTPLE